MPTKWTHSQKAAIEARGSNVLVSAAAGSGKTAVLVERVIRRITDPNGPVPVNRMLIVTFTNAAAAEMRERIYNAIMAASEKRPKNKNLKKQLLMLPQAQITTVHSFCQNLIRSNFHKVGIPYDFEIADNAVSAELRRESMEEVLEESYSAMEEGFAKLVDCYGGKKDDKRLVSTAFAFYDFVQSTEDPEKWLNDAVEMYRQVEIDPNSYVSGSWGKVLLDEAKLRLAGMLELYQNSLEIITRNEEIEVYYDCFNDEKNRLSAIRDICGSTWDETHRAIKREVFWKKLPGRPRNTDDSAAKQVQAIRNGIKKDFTELAQWFSVTAAEACYESKDMLPVAEAFCRLIRDFSKRYSDKKLDSRLLDFNDLEHYAAMLLKDDETAEAVRGQFDEVLVDEYQDTNGVQSRIFDCVSNGSNLFMVGDVKQSIYGFRNARPDIFTNRSDKYEKNGGQGAKISLSSNFRSSGGIIDFINIVFGKIMSKAAGDVDYIGDQLLVHGGETESLPCPVEFHVIEAGEEDSENLTDEQLQMDKDAKEALFIAKRIIELVHKEKPLIYDKTTGGKRPVRYGDIAVLTRKTKGVGEIYAEHMSLAGIPVYVEQAGDFFSSVEIAVIISFLQIIDNPLQDIPLIAVMRSPMFGFTDNELAKIRGENKKGYFYHAVKKSPSSKARAFIETLEHYTEIAKYRPVSFVIEKLLSDTGYYSFAGALPGGGKRMLNLRLLYDRAADFEKKGKKSVFSFISYIKAMGENGIEVSESKHMGENSEAVKIMSIHKSKGLEFPVVFVAKTGLLFNKRDLTEQLLYDVNLGIGADIVLERRFNKYPSMQKLAITCKKQSEILSEEMRILYVALTRARDKLIITGSVLKAEEKLSKLGATVPTPYSVSKQRSFFDWLGMAAGDMAEVHRYQDIAPEYKEIDSSVPSEDFSQQLFAQVEERLCYEYRYRYAGKIPSKLSVREISTESVREYNLSGFDFEGQGVTLSPEERGTVIHFFLQNINLREVSSLKSIKAQLDAMTEKGMLAKEQAAVIDLQAIFGFFSSALGARMLNSKDIRREYKFFVEMPSGEVFEDLEQNSDTILIQGVIDCCFEEDGKFIIIDYKTGSLREEYKKQLEMYAICLERVTGKEVAETCIYPII